MECWWVLVVLMARGLELVRSMDSTLKIARVSEKENRRALLMVTVIQLMIIVENQPSNF